MVTFHPKRRRLVRALESRSFEPDISYPKSRFPAALAGAGVGAKSLGPDHTG